MANLVPSTFRTDFPEFANTTTFPDSAVNFWINFAYLMINQNLFTGALLVMAVETFIAHYLAMEAYAQQQVNTGGIPGLAKGVITSEAAGAVSVAYDVNATLELNAGHWNYTIFGQRFYRLIRMAGTVPLQIGVDSNFAGNLSNGGSTGAWPGPSTGTSGTSN